MANLKFSLALRNVAFRQWLLGNLSWNDYSSIRSVLNRPVRVKIGDVGKVGAVSVNLLDVIAENCAADLMACGKIDAVALSGSHDVFGEIDWSALLDFIKELLPLIMELIQMFMVLFA